MTDPLSPEAVEVQAPPRAKFRRKPLEVDAIQYTGSNPTEVAAFAGEGYTFGPMTDALRIHALEGDLYVFKGHWVVRGGDVDGVTTCPPDVFAAYYDPAPEPLELTPEEQAAKERSEHMSTCHEEACVECMKELRVIRRIVKAVRPVIEKEAKGLGHECMYSQIYANAEKALDELLGPNEEDGCGGGLVADIWHLAHRCEHFDGAPVAAALDQTLAVGEPEGEKQQ